MNQDAHFLEGEGNAWYRRNREYLLAQSGDWASHDVPLRLLRDHPVQMDSILELGCSFGRRLDLLLNMGARQAVGTDASAEAIAEGAERYPRLDLRHALISTPVDGDFDLVIVNFVLHWVDRSSLAKSIAAIDAAVKPDGHLLLGDFFPDRPTSRDYAHKPGLFTFKQDYAACFEALGLYRTVERRIFDHDDPAHPEAEAASIAPQRRGACVLLQKTLDGLYVP